MQSRGEWWIAHKDSAMDKQTQIPEWARHEHQIVLDQYFGMVPFWVVDEAPERIALPCWIGSGIVDEWWYPTYTQDENGMHIYRSGASNVTHG